MQAVLISIQPGWCELIASGKKTVEVRKTKPKLETPFKCYIYCTNVKGRAFFTKGENGNYAPARLGNRKIIGEFVCDKIYDITPHFDTPTFPNQYICGWDYGKEFDCLSFEELTSYLNGKKGYGWHISDLVIYDKPRELSEFFKIGHSEYRKAEWRKRKELEIRIAEYRRITKTNAHLNTEADFEANLKTLSPFKIKRPPQSWCYVESEGEE